MTSVGSRKRTRDGDVKHNTELEDEAPSAKRAVSENVTGVLIPCAELKASGNRKLLGKSNTCIVTTANYHNQSQCGHSSQAGTGCNH